MIGRTPPVKFKKGMELTAKWLADVRNAAVEGSICSLGPGLMGSATPNGWAIGLSNPGRGRAGFLAKTDGTISARVTTTLGTGTVFLTTIDSSTGVITVESDTVDVFNFSSTTGGIATGAYVWVEQDDAGNYFITAVDCGN